LDSEENRKVTIHSKPTTRDSMQGVISMKEQQRSLEARPYKMDKRPACSPTCVPVSYVRNSHTRSDSTPPSSHSHSHRNKSHTCGL
jgi:hypothetical protein